MQFRGNTGQAYVLALERMGLLAFVLSQVFVAHGASLRLAGHKEFILLALGPTRFLHFALRT